MSKDLEDNAFAMQGKELTFKFDSKEAAEHFKLWLSESGEQSYWDWMEYREQDEEGPITGLNFDYWTQDVVHVKCGRLDEAKLEKLSPTK